MWPLSVPQPEKHTSLERSWSDLRLHAALPVSYLYTIIHSNNNTILQVRRRQGVRQPKVVSGIGLWNAPGNALWNAPGRVFSGWSIYTSPQKLIPSPIDSARRVTSIPRVSVSNSHPTSTILRPFPKKRSQKAFRRPPAVHTSPGYIVMGNLRLQQIRRRQGDRQPKVDSGNGSVERSWECVL